MSSAYITEPPTNGKVLVRTSIGDIDVELWSKECPVACRNFVQLCMEHYYDNCIFHRLIPNFMAQTGDPTGTGKGGESIYGKPFKDEIHQRIKFNHRGQVAMANENRPNTNQSQFFITLNECGWLDRKHTIFGKVTGNTIFNVLKLGEVETDDNDFPISDEIPRILSTEVLSCPFDDITPRVSEKEKQEIQRLKALKEKQKLLKKRKKDLKLVSFGDEAEEEEADLQAASSKIKIKAKSLHDVNRKNSKNNNNLTVLKESTQKIDSKIDNGTSIACDSNVNSNKSVDRSPSLGIEQEELISKDKSKCKKDIDKEKKREAKRRAKELKKLHDQARDKKLEKQGPKFKVGDFAKEIEKKADKKLMSLVEQRRAKYTSRSQQSKSREEMTLQMLEGFKSTLNATVRESDSKISERKERTKKENGLGLGLGLGLEYKGGIGENPLEGASDDEDDADFNSPDWMSNQLKFKKHIDDAYRNGTKEDEDYAVIDPLTVEGKKTLNEMESSKRKRKLDDAGDRISSRRRDQDRGERRHHHRRDDRRKHSHSHSHSRR